MAELAIPAVALGALYICSNKEDKKSGSEEATRKEGYSNLDLVQPSTYPSYTALKPPINYPKKTGVNPIANPNAYMNPNAATDKYFDESLFKSDPKNKQLVRTMTGEVIQRKDFEHNNMVPFFGSQVRGRTIDSSSSQSILDNMQGAGSLVERKVERAPLFAPTKDAHWLNGAPNVSDFMQSRENPSERIGGVNPWQEEKVGPGLGKGFSSAGSGGFNSGMEARNSWLPKTVNELRISTNPKETYGLQGLAGPAQSKVVNTGVFGKMEKHLPDTFYVNNPDRWFTTTGAEKGETQRPEQIQPETHRLSTTCAYAGGAGAQVGPTSYSKPEFAESKRTCLPTNPISNLNATGATPAVSTDYGNGSYDILPNNRTTTDSGWLGLVSGTVSALVAPVMDILRPTRKENVIGNARINGDPGSTVPASYVINPADRAPTTIKETTEVGSGTLFATGQQQGGYHSTAHQAVQNQRDTTSCQNMGSVGGAITSTAGTSHLSAYNQTANINKTMTLRTRNHQGGMQVFNHQTNIHVDKRDADRVSSYSALPSVSQAPPSIPDYSTTYVAPEPVSQQQERMDPSLLDAFKRNPYTQSLSSF